MSKTLWQSEEFAGIKKHKEKLTKLYGKLFHEVKGFGGAKIEKLPPGPDRLDQSMVKITLGMSQSDLKRFSDVSSQRTYLFNKATGNATPLDFLPQEPRGGVIASSTEPVSGKVQVRFKKGESEKDIFAEVWSTEADGFVSSLKVSGSFTKIYNDAIFGGLKWSPDGKKVAFVAEVPDPSTYKPFFKDEEKKKDEDDKEKEKKDGKDDDKKKKEEEHWQDEKFLYKENFGETLDSKSKPGVFIFDIAENKVERVHFGKHLDENANYLCDPVFDEHSKGLVFSAINLPVKKLGLNFCLNKKTSLYFLKDPKFSKEDAEKVEEGKYVQNLTKDDYLAMKPSFSRDHSRLVFFASTEKFVAHSSQYQLKSFDWPLKDQQEPKSNIHIDYHPDYPEDKDEFCGIFGYQYSFMAAKFVGNSSRFFAFESDFKGQDRIYIADLNSPGSKPLFVNYLNHDSASLTGNYILLGAHDDLFVFRYSACNQPSQVYVVQMGNLSGALQLSDITFTHMLLTENKLQTPALESAIRSIKKDSVRLPSGADASFLRMTGDHAAECPAKGENGKFPMLTLIHGGPFGSSPLDMLLIQRSYLLLQGYCLLIVNYRGSTGYGKEFLDSLLGHIGSRDVEDCGDLTLKAVEQFPEIVDEKRLTVEGGSHGGFMTGWLVGHPKYKDIWAASSIWNGVLDMSYMVTSSDIPDWIFACCLNKEIEFHSYTAEDNLKFFNMSPISQIKNVVTPTLLVVGTHDYRVPPHQSYFYYNCLKSKGVATKLYNYPDDGHGLGKKLEHALDAYLNISFWLDEYAMKPYRPEDPSEDGDDFQWPPLESNPEIFSDYLTKIGMSKEWTIGEVFGFEEDLLAFIPQPIVAVIVAFEGLKDREEQEKGSEDNLHLVKYYMKQTSRLDNACGIIACLHAIYNNLDQVAIEPESVLDKFMKQVATKTPAEIAKDLDKYDDFKTVHQSFAVQGQSEAIMKTGQDKKVRHHFIAFTVNDKKQLILLDGCIKGPMIVQENCDDVLRGSIKFVQQKLEEGKISEQLSMMTLNKAQ